MHEVLVALIDQLEATAARVPQVMRWGAPVPFFGALDCARIASVGLNPSNREFVDDSESELVGDSRRFHSLRSLRRIGWCDIDADDIVDIAEACREYFSGNPYDRWFRRMDAVLEGTGASLYDEANPACHLDLVPYATSQKWGELPATDRRELVVRCAKMFGMLVRDSRLAVLVLNGKSVVEEVRSLLDVPLEEHAMPAWTLGRTRGAVCGYAYEGTAETIAGVALGRPVLVLGYNHNIQSSFGVTTAVVESIKGWVAKKTRSSK